ncbi:MAG: NADH-quinone oxidoreductase subunit C [Dehalococcoidia bacterium]
MPTQVWSGPQTAAAIERLTPGSVTRHDAVAAFISPERWVESLQALRDDPDADFVHLTNLCGVDWWDRLEVVCHLQSLNKNQLCCVKLEIADRENAVAPSLTSVWHGAWMQECEAYDMFGIRFEGHPNLHRILLWEGFPGWPLRKDFLSLPGGLQPGLNEFAGTARRDEPPVRFVE